MSAGFLTGFPLWQVLLGTIAAFVLAAEVGYRVGVWSRGKNGSAELPDLGISLGGLLGLLGLLLAFTFGMAGARYDERARLVVEDANVIGTVWLRTDLVAEPMRTQARSALREYTQLRLDATGKDRAHVEEIILRSEHLHGALWSAAVAAASAAPTPITGLFVASVNDLIDMHAMRVARSARNPIPAIILVTLYAVSILVLLALGFSRGLEGDRSPLATSLLALILAVVLYLTLDLDRPGGGYLRVSQRAMLDVRAMMGP